MHESVELSIEVCHRLLRSGTVGRVAVSTPNGPHIVPVNYVVADESLIFRTSPYSILGTNARSSLLAFEVDHVGTSQEDTWSVVVRGRCEYIADPSGPDGPSLPEAWAAGSRNLFLRLPWSEVTGRKLGLHWDPLVRVNTGRTR